MQERVCKSLADACRHLEAAGKEQRGGAEKEKKRRLMGMEAEAERLERKARCLLGMGRAQTLRLIFLHAAFGLGMALMRPETEETLFWAGLVYCGANACFFLLVLAAGPARQKRAGAEAAGRRARRGGGAVQQLVQRVRAREANQSWIRQDKER